VCGGSEVGREGGGWGVNLLSRMAEGLHCPRGMASSLAVCRGNGPRVATLQVNEFSTTFVRYLYFFSKALCFAGV
jgi:hypothetical protein